MKTKRVKRIVALLSVLTFVACEPEEQPIPAVHKPGDLVTQSINLETDYRYQKFYSLEDTAVVSENLKTIWDLGFESGSQGWRVKLNIANAMQAAKVSEGLTEKSNVSNVEWWWDEPTGNWDSTAIGDWKTYDGVYLIDRGYNPNGTHRGYVKLKMLSNDEQTFSFKWSANSSEDVNEVTINKQEGVNLTCFSFTDNQVVQVEPEQNSWDLVFTQYLHIFRDEDEPQIYLVTGVLGNLHTTEFALDTAASFENIDLAYAEGLEYSKDMKTIGYHWKDYNYDAGSFIILYHKNYLIKRGNDYYKMKFIDFYNDQGEKGNPTFELQKL